MKFTLLIAAAVVGFASAAPIAQPQDASVLARGDSPVGVALYQALAQHAVEKRQNIEAALQQEQAAQEQSLMANMQMQKMQQQVDGKPGAAKSATSKRQSMSQSMEQMQQQMQQQQQTQSMMQKLQQQLDSRLGPSKSATSKRQAVGIPLRPGPMTQQIEQWASQRPQYQQLLQELKKDGQGR